MKKSFLAWLLLFALVLLPLSACKTNKAYPEYTVTDNDALGCVELHCDGITYRPYGVFPTKDFQGDQIGIRQGDPDSKIYQVKGYETSEWIIEYLDVIMGGHMIFKSTTVTEIPAELKAYQSYDY